jgi:pimeloyl-ACP methyl ester carboxylesterase
MRRIHLNIFVSFAVLGGLFVHVEKAFGREGAAMKRQAGQSRAVLNSCRIPDVEGEARCGTYEVFENRGAKRGRRIPLKLVVLPALGPESAPDALFILAGGPGQAATDNAEFYARTFARVRRERDIVMIDQRGTGGSNPLNCDLYGASTRGHLGDLLPVEAIRACRAEWERRADLRLYTTPVAMGDLDEVRAALGYERVNLFGTSYGTRAAQVYMRLYPERVRSVIMKGVTPITAPLTLAMARDAQRALDILFEDCAADEACRAAFPNLKAEFRAVLRRLERGPVEVELTDPSSGRAERVEMSRGAVTPTLRSLMQSVGGAAQLPLLIHRAAGGDFAPLARAALSIRRPFQRVVSVGVFLSIPNAEDLPFTDARRLARESEGTFLGDYYFRQLARAAELLPRGRVPRDYHEPVRSDVPALLISGHLDPATPPGGGDEVARYLPNSLHVVVRYGSHAYGGLSPCVDDLMARFVSEASVKGLDTSCVSRIRRPPFVVKEGGG